MKGTRVRTLREKLGASLGELAARSGLLPDYLEKIEDGLVQPTEGDLIRIQKALKRIKQDKSEPDDPHEEVVYDPRLK